MVRRESTMVLDILDILRRAKHPTVRLKTVLRDLGFDSRIGPTTGLEAARAIKTLVESGFVELSAPFHNARTDEAREVYSFDDPDVDPYYVLRALDSDDGLLLTLTRKLQEVQSVLGISLSALIDESRGGVMRVRPMFGEPELKPDRPDGFVLMPLASHFQAVYEDHIQKVCESLGVRCKRADDIFGSGSIVSDIWSLISTSSVIIADCTSRNANVFYELGVAHTIGKRVVIVTQSEADIPFDIKHLRYIMYQHTPRGMAKFEELLLQYLRQELRVAGKLADEITPS